jgi:hypothetical protein
MVEGSLDQISLTNLRQLDLRIRDEFHWVGFLISAYIRDNVKYILTVLQNAIPDALIPHRMRNLTHLSFGVRRETGYYHPQHLALLTVQDLRIEFNSAEHISACINSLMVPNLRCLSVTFMEPGPSNYYTPNLGKHFICDIETGKFPYLSHLNLGRLPLCLAVQMMLRLKGPILCSLAVGFGFSWCTEQHHPPEGENNSVFVLVLSIQGMISPRKGLCSLSANFFNFPA